MANYFNPGSPRFRRGVILLSAYACSFAGAHVLMADFGKQEHVFSPVQRFLVPQIDQLLNVSEDDIKNYVATPRDKDAKPFIRLKKVDTKSQPPSG